MNSRLRAERTENVSGYVIRMWHLEDLLRAARFDPSMIRDTLVDPMDGDPDLKDEAQAWYVELAERMVKEGVAEEGHLLEVVQALDELEALHQALLKDAEDKVYVQLYAAAKPAIDTLTTQSDAKERTEVEVCFTGVYGVMLLQAQGRELSEATMIADHSIRALLEALSGHYRNMRHMPGISLN